MAGSPVEVETGINIDGGGDSDKRKDDIGPGKGLVNSLKRFWYYIYVIVLAVKWSLIEMLTKHKRLNEEELSDEEDPRKTVVITGGARGIGAEVVKQCLQQGLNVIIGCRTTSSADNLITKFREEGITTGSAEAFPLDLKSLSSVRLFAQSVLKKNVPVQILINNAGVMFPPFEVTTDGFEGQFQTNYLSHFLLTMLLLPALNSGGTPEEPSRVVNVSSIAHYGGQIDFDNIDLKYLYSPHKAYMSSKLMQVMSTADLDRRFQEEGLHIRVFSVHPGVIRSDLYKNVMIARISFVLCFLMYKSPKQGADGIMFVARSPKIANEGGSYFANCSKYPPNPLALNGELQQTLYTLSRTLCGLSKTDNLGARLGFQVNENKIKLGKGNKINVM